MPTQIVRKITTKTCNFDVSDLRKLAVNAGEGEVIDLYRIAGIISEIRPGQTDLGPYAKFLGQFQAQRVDGGGTFSSGVAILPKVLEELMYGAVAQAREKGASVEFAAMISIVPDNSSVTGYVFTARSLKEVSHSDQMTKLLESAGMQTRAGSSAQPAKIDVRDVRTLPAPAKERASSSASARNR